MKGFNLSTLGVSVASLAAFVALAVCSASAQQPNAPAELGSASAQQLKPAGKAAADLGHATMAGARSVDLSAAPQMSPSALSRAQPIPHPRTGISDAEYAQRKALAAKASLAPSRSPAPAPSDTFKAGQETPGANVAFIGQQEIGTIAPSDMALAVSQAFVVQVVNSAIAVYNKSGVLQSGYPKALTSLFPGSSGDLGDPRAYYDFSRNRFVVVVDDFTNGVIRLAASTTNNPTGTWFLYSFGPWGAANCRASGSACADFPQVGFNDDTLFLGINFFPAAGGVSDYMLLLPKATIYAGGAFSFRFWFNLSVGGTLVDTVQPVTLLTGSEHPRAGFAVNTKNINFGGGQCSGVSGCNGLTFWAFSNNLVKAGTPGPELSAVSIATATTYRLPANANEPGSANSIDTGDVRISGTPTYHSGVITGSFNTNGPDGHSHVVWFQAEPVLNDNDPRCTGAFLNACPQITGATKINEDCFFCGGQGTAGSSYYGTLASDVGGNLTMIYNYSDNNINPETAYTSRRVTQTQNTMHDAGFVLCSGGGRYNQGRWGDYTGAVGDPSNANQGYMWFSGMNSLSNGNWGTCIGRNGFTSSTQP